MADFSSYEGFRDTLIGMLLAGVLGLAGLVRKLDVGSARLENEVDWLRERISEHKVKDGE